MQGRWSSIFVRTVFIAAIAVILGTRFIAAPNEIGSSGNLALLSDGGPTISNVTVDSISYSTARIQWNTDVPSYNTRVMYDSLTSAPPFANSTELKNASPQTAQGFTLGGLAPGTTYYFEPCSTNASTNVEACGPVGQFATAPAPSNPFQSPTLPNSPTLPSMPVINGATFTVASDCSDLQSDINQAAATTGSANMQILISPSTVCTGPYYLPARAGTGWIVVRSAASDSALPAQGTRIDSSYASAMTTITAPNESSGLGTGITTSAPTSNWRFVGIQFTIQPGSYTDSLVTMFPGQTTNVIFDRDIFYSIGNVPVSIYANGNETVIANSSLTNIRPDNFGVGIEMTSAQGITIDNNYIDAPGISVFSEETAPAGYPTPQGSDYTITRNYFQWDADYTTSTITRQMLEFKSGNRILISGNIFSGQWDGGQTGNFSSAIVLTPRNGSIGEPSFNNYISDVTITNNILYNDPGGIGVVGAQNNLVTTDVPATKRVLIQNNLMYDMNGLDQGSGHSAWGSPLTFGYSLEDVVIDHNTIFDPRGEGPWIIAWSGGPGSSFKLTNNILGQNYTAGFGGIWWYQDTSDLMPAPPAGAGSTALTANALSAFDGFSTQSPKPDPNLTVNGNLILPGVMDTSLQANYDNPADAYSPALCTTYWSGLPGNQCAGNASTITADEVFSSVGFEGPLTTTTGFQLAPASPYRNSASDGTDPGVNMTTLLAATANTLTGGGSSAPLPPPVSSPPPSPAASSTSPVSLVASPTGLTFTSETVGVTSPLQEIALVNNSASNVTVSNVAITGDFAIHDNFCDSGIIAGTHCNVDVVFTPTTNGARTGTLTFTESGVTNSPQVITLTGTGTGGAVSSPTPTPTPAPAPTPTPAPTSYGVPSSPATSPSKTISTASSSSTATSSVVTFTQTLSLGSTGAQVTALQVVLQNLGFFPASTTPTLTFGKITQHAVLLFQSAHDLTQTGALTPQTETLLNKVVAASPSLIRPSIAAPTAVQFTQALGLGSQSSQVALLQKVLTQDGDYSGPITGYFWTLTQQAVERLQIKYGIIYSSIQSSPAWIQEDYGYGMVGPKTRAKLNALL